MSDDFSWGLTVGIGLAVLLLTILRTFEVDPIAAWLSWTASDIYLGGK